MGGLGSLEAQVRGRWAVVGVMRGRGAGSRGPQCTRSHQSLLVGKLLLRRRRRLLVWLLLLQLLLVVSELSSSLHLFSFLLQLLLFPVQLFLLVLEFLLLHLELLSVVHVLLEMLRLLLALPFLSVGGLGLRLRLRLRLRLVASSRWGLVVCVGCDGGGGGGGGGGLVVLGGGHVADGRVHCVQPRLVLGHQPQRRVELTVRIGLHSNCNSYKGAAVEGGEGRGGRSRRHHHRERLSQHLSLLLLLLSLLLHLFLLLLHLLLLECECLLLYGQSLREFVGVSLRFA